MFTVTIMVLYSTVTLSWKVVPAGYQLPSQLDRARGGPEVPEYIEARRGSHHPIHATSCVGTAWAGGSLPFINSEPWGGGAEYFFFVCHCSYDRWPIKSESPNLVRGVNKKSALLNVPPQGSKDIVRDQLLVLCVCVCVRMCLFLLLWRWWPNEAKLRGRGRKQQCPTPPHSQGQ